MVEYPAKKGKGRDTEKSGGGTKKGKANESKRNVATPGSVKGEEGGSKYSGH